MIRDRVHQVPKIAIRPKRYWEQRLCEWRAALRRENASLILGGIWSRYRMEIRASREDGSASKASEQFQPESWDVPGTCLHGRHTQKTMSKAQVVASHSQRFAPLLLPRRRA